MDGSFIKKNKIDKIMGRIFIIIGGIIFFIGLLLSVYDKLPYIGKLPGDIHFKNENFSFYIPITTSIILSIIVSIIFYVIKRFGI